MSDDEIAEAERKYQEYLDTRARALEQLRSGQASLEVLAAFHIGLHTGAAKLERCAEVLKDSAALVASFGGEARPAWLAAERLRAAADSTRQIRPADAVVAG